jgi:hypothetical protein
MLDLAAAAAVVEMAIQMLELAVLVERCLKVGSVVLEARVHLVTAPQGLVVRL